MLATEMIADDLLQKPIWRASDLGRPIPASTHAVSVALPRWQDVVGYEEKKPEVIDRLATGYPRFIVHPLVQKLAAQIAGDRPCLPFPSERAAGRAASFVRRFGDPAAELVSRDGIFGVATTREGLTALKAFWQHTGLIVSSRQAEALLAGRRPKQGNEQSYSSLRAQLAQFYGCAPDDIFLAPTGMASIFDALKAVGERTPGAATAQLGFPYVDTLKLQEKLGHGGILLHHLGNLETELRALLDRQPIAGCFCEVPGNPLLGCADLHVVSPLLRERGVPLIVDDVVATPINVDLTPHADLIVTSLTKFIVGSGDAMGGALICNPLSPLHRELKAILNAQHEELLWPGDAAVLEQHARTFPQRMRRHNQSGLLMAERLRRHPSIERVWYPKWEFAEAYEAVRRPEGGWGALITFLPKNAALNSPLVYDRLPFCKGPSLGTVFTLACPFTLLAHYTELDWAESCGVSRYLIRISVGLEDPEELWTRLDAALG
ncbi:MAG TPA: PLP-dependent transferase [Verrucomicrobiae bacterium]|nr:PLP-dependent transferase [Verrucomicrobiae bacterium]